MKTTMQRCIGMTTSLVVFGVLVIPWVVSAQELTVRGRVAYSPTLPECRQDAPCVADIALTRPEDWIPTPAAVNVVVQGTDRVTKTDRNGYYEVSVPSPDVVLLFLYIGHNRIEVPVDGRGVVDVKLTPTPLPVLERLLGVIMPQIQVEEYPDIDRLASLAGVNRETARDILWLVLGDRPMMEHYPGEYIPDYRFDVESLPPEYAGDRP